MNSNQLIVGFYYIRAAMAQKKGLFDQEITPVTTKFVDENGTERTITVTKDDGIRPGTTFEGLAKLKPAFKETGSTTAGVHIQNFWKVIWTLNSNLSFPLQVMPVRWVTAQQQC